MGKNLLRSLFFSALLLVGTSVSSQSLIDKLQKSSIKEALAKNSASEKDLKTPAKKVAKKTPAKKTKEAASKSRFTAEVSLTLPTLETTYSFDSETEFWVETGYATNEYDANGNLILKAYFSYYMEDTLSKYVFEYDSRGNLIKDSYYNFDNHTNLLVLNDANAKEYIVDANGRLESVIYKYFTENMWENGYKEVYAYTGNEEAPSSIAFYDWDGEEWVEDGAYMNITWFDFANFEVKSYEQEFVEEGETYRGMFTSTSPGNGVELYEIKVEDSWVPAVRYTTTTDAQGNETELKEEYNDGLWVNSYKEINYVDGFGNEAGYAEYDFVEGEWVLEYSSLYTNTYDNDGILIEQIKTYVGYSYKTVFSEFETFVITSTTDAVASFELKAFPNPVSDVLTISIPNQESAKIQVYTLQHALLQSATAAAGSASISLSNLPAGVYILQVETASGLQKTERIVKR